MIKNTAQFIDLLRQQNELLEINDEIDAHLELAEIQRRVVAQKGRALLFHRVKGCEFKVATNLFGSEKRIDLAFSQKPVEWIREAVQFAETCFPPKLSHLWQMKGLARELFHLGTSKVKTGPVIESEISDADLSRLPQLKCWPEDGGAFITLPLVYTQSPVTKKSNLGMYRIQLFNQHQCGMHIQIHRGGGFHYHEAEKRGESLPVHIYIGGPPSLVLAAVAPLPEDVPEILMASLLSRGRLKMIHNPKLSPLPIIADADFCIAGEIPPFERKPEGPFGDHYGYYSLKHDYPFVNVKKIFHRKDAIYPATVVGRPPQEDHFMACYLQDLLKPLIHLVMPQVHEVWAYEESGVHSLAAAVVQDRYPREALTTALRILGEGQLSLSKVLMVTDQKCDVKDFKTLFQIILERIDFQKDLFVLSHISQDSLDYTTPHLLDGSKAIFLGLGEPIRDLPKEFSGCDSSSQFQDFKVFCPGALVVQGAAYQKEDNMAQILAHDPKLSDWPMIFLVDDASEAVRSAEDFIWHVFTRFEPAGDVYARDIKTQRFHIGLSLPVVIDCRMKPWYPGVLESDPDVVKKLKPVFDKYKL